MQQRATRDYPISTQHATTPAYASERRARLPALSFLLPALASTPFFLRSFVLPPASA